MQQLRYYGVYQPPGDLKPVLAVRAGTVYYLYDKVHGAALPPRFRVESDGSVINWHGDSVGWNTADLIDTGETRDVGVSGISPDINSE